MDLVDMIKGLFGGKKSLDKIPLDDLRKERLRLEQIENRLTKDVDQYERRKQELFAKGKDETSQRQQIALARKIKELDAGAQAKDKQLAMVSRQMRVLTGFMMIKENQALVSELGVSSIITSMDLDELQNYVERATIEGQFQMDRFAQLVQTMEGPEGAEGTAEDADTLAIVAAMQEAKQAELEDPESAVESGIDKIDKILHKGEGEKENPESI